MELIVDSSSDPHSWGQAKQGVRAAKQEAGTQHKSGPTFLPDYPVFLQENYKWGFLRGTIKGINRCVMVLNRYGGDAFWCLTRFLRNIIVADVRGAVI